MNSIITLLTLVLGPWTITMDEASSLLTFENKENQVVVAGKLSLHTEFGDFTVVPPRDAVGNRLALLDPWGNVQGYVTFQQNGERLSFLVQHRTRQFFEGDFTFDGEITFRPDSFACQTVPNADSRVLSLADGPTDSLLNDTLFAREEDLALQVLGENVSLTSRGEGRYGVKISGAIHKAAEAAVTFNLEKNFFKNRYVPYYKPIDRKRCPSPPTGWMSWNTYFDKATAEDNLAEARLGQKYFQPFGMEFWSIESWQGNSDHLPVSDFYNMNLEVNENQFPLGMKKLADDIRELGFRPGLWTAPYGTGNDEFYQAHKDWFLHDEEGKPLGCWNGRYSLDPTHPEALANLKRIHDVASHEWGYEFFKVDGMSGGGPAYMAHFYEDPQIRARFYDPNCPNPFEQTVAVIREGIGPDRVFLACQGHLTGPEASFADAARIGSDIVGCNHPVGWQNILQQAGRTLNQIFINNIVFFTDPDTLLVGDLDKEQAQVTTTIVSLPGQMMFSGDKLAKLRPDKVKMIQQTLPVADIHPENLYPYFDLLPIWDLRVARPFLTWDVVALFNWEDQAKEVGFNIAELGLPADEDYILYEFWTEQYLGTMRNEYSMTLPPRSVRLLAVHKKQTVPQFLSSDRHITQGAVDLTALKWKEDSRQLTGKVRLVADHPTTLRFTLPEGFVFQKGTFSDPNLKAEDRREAQGAVLTLTLTAPTTEETEFTLDF